MSKRPPTKRTKLELPARDAPPEIAGPCIVLRMDMPQRLHQGQLDPSGALPTVFVDSDEAAYYVRHTVDRWPIVDRQHRGCFTFSPTDRPPDSPAAGEARPSTD